MMFMKLDKWREVWRLHWYSNFANAPANMPWDIFTQLCTSLFNYGPERCASSPHWMAKYESAVAQGGYDHLAGPSKALIILSWKMGRGVPPEMNRFSRQPLQCVWQLPNEPAQPESIVR